MTGSIEERNKAIVRNAFEALFNERDFAAAEAFFSPNYVQHSAHIPPGREGLFELVKSFPSTHQREMVCVARSRPRSRSGSGRVLVDPSMKRPRGAGKDLVGELRI